MLLMTSPDSRTIKDILAALSESERKVLAEIIEEERKRVAHKTARDMDAEIARSLEFHVK